MKIAAVFDLNDSRQLSRLVWLTLAALIVVVAVFGGYYYWDRYVHLGDQSPFERGVEHLEQMVRENPDDPDARMALAQYYFQGGAYAQAVEQYANAARFVPDFAEVYQGMMASYAALSQTDLGAYVRGMEAFSLKDAVTNQPNHVPALTGLGLSEYVEQHAGGLLLGTSFSYNVFQDAAYYRVSGGSEQTPPPPQVSSVWAMLFSMILMTWRSTTRAGSTSPTARTTAYRSGPIESLLRWREWRLHKM